MADHLAAHRVFVSSLPPVDPILQEISSLSQVYKPPPIVLSKTTDVSKDDQPEVADEVGRMARDGVHESISTEVFSGYQFKEIVKGCQPHPGDIVEAGSLASLSGPEPTYPLTDSLPENVVKTGKLSCLQLEGIMYSCQRHQLILPDGQRAGFFIGDAAGVGKGRQIAGIIFDNFCRSRTKHIWFTISSDLIVDARRDLTDIGCHIKVIDGCQELDKETRVLGLPADFKEGVVFSTYATLVSSVQRGNSLNGNKQSRLQQLVGWCGGKDFDGCLVFDECHKAKNFVPGKEHASTKVAMAVATIQRMLPKARVVYCSATGVTDVKNMAFMERLGLWGDGAPFRSFEHFIDSVQRKGLGMAEMLAMEMKTSGMYVSRGLSYKQAEFVTVEACLTKDQKKIYSTAAHVWNELRKALESSIVRTSCSNSRIWSNFWSSHQRFFKQMCMGMKVPSILQETQEALDAGYCVVIGLQTTGEASLESELSKRKGIFTGFVSLCREILSRFIDQHFPTRVESPSGTVPDDQPQDDPWSVTAKTMLQDFAKKIKLPDSPLDEIVDKLGGPNAVAEMTGRKGRIVRHSPDDQPEYEVRGCENDSYGVESLNVRERNLFMEGKKLIAIISDAASTGISLHADQRVANHRRRVHMTIELPWSADKAVQQLGRSHRSNQTSGPLYKLITTDLGGERRFAASVARRLQSLGALTKGDRRAATGADLGEFNFDTPYGRNALRTMFHHICHKQLVPGLSLEKILGEEKHTEEEFNCLMQGCLVLMGLVEVDSLKLGPQLKDKDAGDVGKFLNRILGMKVENQNLIFNYFTECMKLMISNAQKEGRYNEGLLDITGTSVNMVGKPREVFKDLAKGHGTTRSVEVNIDRGMSWEMAVTRMNNYKGTNDGFYVSRREVWGKHLYLLATQKENSSHLFHIARPNTGLSLFEEEKSDLFNRYLPVSAEKAEKNWREQYTQTEDQCVHGPSCKNSHTCRVGSRCYRLHLLCGNIVTLMSVLESTINRFSLKLSLSKSETMLRVVRVQLNSGERIVGIRYPSILISEVEKVLKEQQMMENYRPSQTLAPGQLQTLMGSQSLALNSSQSLALNSSQSLALESKELQTLAFSQSQTSATSGEKAKDDLEINHVIPVKRTVIEEVTPVSERCLRRAITPPVTLKKFFKPVVKPKIVENETEIVLKNSDDTEKNDSNSKGIQSVKRQSSCEVSFDEFCQSFSDKTGKTEDLTNNNSQANDPVNRLARKRSADNLGSFQRSKKPKQSTLFSSFAKQQNKKIEEENKIVKCPVCNMEFEKGVSNQVVNEHVDNCLIE